MPTNLIRWITRLLLAGFLVLLLATLVMQRRRILVLTGEVATLREENRDVTRLRQENAEIEKLRNENQEVERLRKDMTDLPRLRNEARQLREANAEVTTLRGANEQLRTKLTEREAVPPIAAVVSNAPALFTRTFKVNRAAMLAFGGDGQNTIVTNGWMAVKQAFANAGVDLNPPKSMFYGDGKGMLMVRATLSDLDTIEQLLPTLNLTGPEAPVP
jgi:hypothetical protein